MTETQANPQWTIQTPVVFIIFNRPEKARQVFERIRQARPPILFIIADGPRADCPDDPKLCEETRAILDFVDWPCDVRKNIADENMGCGFRAISGLDWVFEQVNEAIILEDDCLPDPSFFPFCEQMLEKYQDDETVFSVTGTNPIHEWKSATQSYHFARYAGIWGWGTWKRAWKHYDYYITAWDDEKTHRLVREAVWSEREYRYFAALFNRIREGAKTSPRTLGWDFQWFLSRLIAKGKSVVPSINLVTNIGFDPGGTHMADPDDIYANLPMGRLEFPLRHPATTEPDKAYDQKDLNLVLRRETFWYKAKRKLRKILSGQN